MHMSTRRPQDLDLKFYSPPPPRTNRSLTAQLQADQAAGPCQRMRWQQACIVVSHGGGATLNHVLGRVAKHEGQAVDLDTRMWASPAPATPGLAAVCQEVAQVVGL